MGRSTRCGSARRLHLQRLQQEAGVQLQRPAGVHLQREAGVHLKQEAGVLLQRVHLRKQLEAGPGVARLQEAQVPEGRGLEVQEVHVGGGAGHGSQVQRQPEPPA